MLLTKLRILFFITPNLLHSTHDNTSQQILFIYIIKAVTNNYVSLNKM